MNARFSTMADTSVMANDVGVTGIASLDAWRIISRVASANQHGLQQGLRWLCILARSGVDIPIATFSEFNSLTQRFDLSWQETSFLVEALFCAIWLRSLGRQELQATISSIHSRIAPQLLTAIRSNELSQACVQILVPSDLNILI